MKRYVKIDWMYNDYEVPRIMQLDRCIEIDLDLRDILEARAHGRNKILSINEYKPKAKFLILYIGVNGVKSDKHNNLVLTLSDICNLRDGDDLKLIKNFGKFEENELIYDEIRISDSESLEKEEANQLYFREFMKDCTGQMNSILGVLLDVFQCSSYYLNEKADFPSLTMTEDN